MSTSSGRPTFEFDALFFGALRGWLVGLCGLVLWLLINPTDPYGRVIAFVFSGVILSLCFLGLVVIVGVPCFDVLRRLLPDSTAPTWGLCGALAFGMPAAVLITVLEPKQDRALPGTLLAAVAYTTLAGISGAVTFYFARKTADD